MFVLHEIGTCTESKSSLHNQLFTPDDLHLVYSEHYGKMQKIQLRPIARTNKMRLYFTMMNIPYQIKDVGFCAHTEDVDEFLYMLNLLLMNGDISEGAYRLASIHVQNWPDRKVDYINIYPYYGVVSTLERDQKMKNNSYDAAFKYYQSKIFKAGVNMYDRYKYMTAMYANHIYNDIRDVIKKVQINEKKKVVTIVWTDGEVTIARCGSNDIWDPEKGLLVCIAKRMFVSGTQMNKWLKAQIPDPEPVDTYVPKHAAE